MTQTFLNGIITLNQLKFLNNKRSNLCLTTKRNDKKWIVEWAVLFLGKNHIKLLFAVKASCAACHEK